MQLSDLDIAKNFANRLNKQDKTELVNYLSSLQKKEDEQRKLLSHFEQEHGLSACKRRMDKRTFSVSYKQ